MCGASSARWQYLTGSSVCVAPAPVAALPFPAAFSSKASGSAISVRCIKRSLAVSDWLKRLCSPSPCWGPALSQRAPRLGPALSFSLTMVYSAVCNSLVWAFCRRQGPQLQSGLCQKPQARPCPWSLPQTVAQSAFEPLQLLRQLLLSLELSRLEFAWAQASSWVVHHA